MSLPPGNATIETLTRDLLAEECADAQGYVDDSAAAALLRERFDRQLRALDLLAELDLENMTVERETGVGGLAYTFRAAGSTGPVDGLLGRVGVLTKERPATVAYGGAYGATAQGTTITAALMLLAAVDVEARGGAR